MASSTEYSPYRYRKRPGTSGIRGQLYETKLLSLIYFRAIHNAKIEDFYLATNVDRIGSFDDICFKAKFKGNNKPIVVFLQAKHRENNNSVLSLNERDLVDYFNSYLEIRLKFETNNTDVLFNEGLNETDCRFVIYTTAKGDKTNKIHKGSLADDLNALMRTGDPGSQPSHDKNDEEVMCKTVLKEQMAALAQQMVKCIRGEFHDIQMLMQNEIVLLYHVLLGQQVFDISEIQPEGHRDANIKEYAHRDDFELFRRKLLIKMPMSQLRQKFKVPASFGNKDLTIKGGDEKIERKLNDLTSKIIRLIEESKPNKIVIIDESMGTGFLQLSGGIASAVGNLLILDESRKLMKINDDYESLGNLGKTLYRKLKDKINDLNEYKFDVKAKIFPKLSLATDEYQKRVVSDFLSSLLFYTSQQSEEKVEEILMAEITSCQGDDVQHVEVTSDAIFLKYHDEVQKWSMKSEEGMGTYLEKEGSLYKNAVDAASKRLTSVINMMYRIKNKKYTQRRIFREEAVNTIKFDSLLSGTIIVTDNSELTVAKLIKHLTNTDILDFEYILNLSERDHRALRDELMNTKEVKKLLVVFINAQSINTSSSRKLENIANSMKDIKVIIVTDQDSVENAKVYFSPTGNVVKDELKLIDFSEESQKRILEDAKVIFQGINVNYFGVPGIIYFWVSDMMEYVGGAVLNKMLHDKRCVIGKPISNPNYKPELYIERAVSCKKEGTSYIRFIDSHYADDVIIIGEPGMGKSTLLTHLSNETKKYFSDWVLRINLLEYTKEFSKWKVKKTNIDIFESLKFLCKAALSEENSKTKDLNITLEEFDGDVRLKDCNGDECTIFELKMFLNFYKRSRVLILFDGFDEICPTYVKEVSALIIAVQQYRRRPRSIWITSRSYDNMKGFESDSFGKFKIFKLKPLNYREQNQYLRGFWDEKAILKNLNDDQLQNVYDFIIFMTRSSRSDELDMLKAKSDLPIESINKKPFVVVFSSFISYLSGQIVSAPRPVMNALRLLDYKRPRFYGESFAIPIHLNIIAEYLCNKIKEVNIEPHNWDWDTNIFNIYEDFMVTKIKRIRFQEKTQNDMSKPDNISAYEREYADFKDKHKKLAAYAFYDKCLFNDNEITKIEEMIYKLKQGEERTGVICEVVNDVPIFVHSTFAEYFAVEYICDLLKREDHQESLTAFILNEMFFNCNNNILATLDSKIEIDEKLSAILIRNKSIIFDLLLKEADTQNEQDEIKSFLCKVMRMNLRNIRHLFLLIIKDSLDESNLMDFIKLVIGTNMFLIAVKMEFEEFVLSIVDLVKAIDDSKLILLFKDFVHNENVGNLSSDELVQKIHTHVWTRMDIVPDWENLEDFLGNIIFI